MLTYLNPRKPLSPEEKNQLEIYTKGYKGEWKFYELLKEHVHATYIGLFDLQLELNNNEFQIDSLLIFQDAVYLIELKNFEGDFLVNGEAWHTIPSKKEVQNPLQQLHRKEVLLKDFLRLHGFNWPVKPFLIFINPRFTLYQAPYNQKIVFPGQIMRFLQMLNQGAGKLIRMHNELKEVLVERHIVRSRRVRLPEFEFEQLKKGLFCRFCGGELVEANKSWWGCAVCKEKESKDDAILRSAYEFHIIFPERKITVNALYEWCGGMISKRSIQRILLNNLKLNFFGRGTFYTFDEMDHESLLNLVGWNQRSISSVRG